MSKLKSKGNGPAKNASGLDARAIVGAAALFGLYLAVVNPAALAKVARTVQGR